MIDKEVINEYVTDMTKYYASTHNGEIPSQFEKYLRKAVEKGLELSKIKWHDLRKDPNDLPEGSAEFVDKAIADAEKRLKESETC